MEGLSILANCGMFYVQLSETAPRLKIMGTAHAVFLYAHMSKDGKCSNSFQEALKYLLSIELFSCLFHMYTIEQSYHGLKIDE